MKRLSKAKPGIGFGTIRVTGVLVLAVLLLTDFAAAKNIFSWRTVMCPTINFKNAEQMKVMEAYFTRMKDAGYNGIFMDSFVMAMLKDQSPKVKAQVQSLVAAAKTAGIAIIPMSQGQDGGMFRNENLVEVMGCKGTPFVVSNGIAMVAEDPSVQLVNGGFEDSLNGWRYSPHFKIDNSTKRTGNASLRCDDPMAKYVRAFRRVTLRPYRVYELSMWVKTQGIVSSYGNMPRDVGFTVQSPLGKYIFNERTFKNGLMANSNWKQIRVHFYSLDRTFAQIDVQATEGRQFSGRVWFDDVKITEVGLFDTMVRENLDIVVKTENGATLTPGKDYVVGNRKLTIPAGSAAKNGDRLLVDWYTRATMANAAYCYNQVWDNVRREIALQDEWFDTPRARLMKYSEWRLAGWDPWCMQKYDVQTLGSGRYMAAVANNTQSLYREANGARMAVVWNDAYDPFHNASKDYWMVNGGCIGSGYELDPDVVILNWNAIRPRRFNSLRFFAGTDTTNRPGWGVKKSRHRQIIAPGGAWAGWRDWLPRLDTLEEKGDLPDGSVIGIAYNAWGAFPGEFQEIETMKAACEKAGRWGSGPIPFPAAKPGVPFTYDGSIGVRQGASDPSSNLVSFAVTQNLRAQTKTIRFSLPQAKMVRLTLINSRGQEVVQILNEGMVAGSHQRKIDLSEMATGIYFVRLVLEGGRESFACKLVHF